MSIGNHEKIAKIFFYCQIFFSGAYRASQSGQTNLPSGMIAPQQTQVFSIVETICMKYARKKLLSFTESFYR